MHTFDSVYVSLEERSLAEEIMITPNPAGDVVRIELSDNSVIDQVSLYDLSGRRLRRFEDPSEELNLSGLPKGLVIVEVRTATRVIREKIVRE